MSWKPQHRFDPDEQQFYGLRCTHQPSPWMGDYGCPAAPGESMLDVFVLFYSFLFLSLSVSLSVSSFSLSLSLVGSEM